MLHLFHPALVHFSVAFLTAGGLLEAAGIFLGRQGWSRAGNRLVWAGLVSLLPTIASGYLAINTLDVPPAAERLAWHHERNAWIALGGFFASRFWKAWNRGSLARPAEIGYALLTLAAVAWLLFNAWLGAELVYVHGLGVAAS